MLIAVLWLVFFFDLVIVLLIPSTETMIFTTDGSAARYSADFFAMLIGLYVLYQQGWKKLPSKWLMAFLVFMMVSHFHAINIHFDGAFIPTDLAIYDYKPMLECLMFFIMFMGIYTMKLTEQNIAKIKQSLCWIAVVYGIFSVLQRLGFDQFYKIIDLENVSHMSRNPEVGGFICQPVFCAAFLAILFPIVLKTKSWWKIVSVLAGILATGNRSALIVVFIAALYLFNFRMIAKVALAAYIAYLIVGVACYTMNIHLPYLGEERFRIWHDVVADSLHSKCPGIHNAHILTGIGIGAYSVIMPYFYTGWLQAHNEYLECTKCLGVIGFWLAMMFTFRIPVKDSTLAACVLSSFILALTNATWHIPQLAFLTVFIIALLFNMEDQNGIGQPHSTRES